MKGILNSHQIREETNTKIDLPTENSNSEMIVITGRKSNCEAARDRILAIQRELVRNISASAAASGQKEATYSTPFQIFIFHPLHQ